MKKIIALLFALALAMALAFPCVAADETVDAVTFTDESETVAEAEKTASETVRNVIDNLTTSSFWISLGTYLVAALAVVGFVGQKFSGIASLIKSKADADAVKSAIENAAGETYNMFNKKIEELTEKLDAAETEEKKLQTILAIFITNAKIPAAAQAEIVQILSDTKKASDNIGETVEKVKDLVEAAKAEAEANAPATPALDELTAYTSEENYEIGVI